MFFGRIQYHNTNNNHNDDNDDAAEVEQKEKEWQSERAKPGKAIR
jgi:hypothetical protein